MEIVGRIVFEKVVIKTFNIIYYTLITFFHFFQKLIELYKYVLVSITITVGTTSLYSDKDVHVITRKY